MDRAWSASPLTGTAGCGLVGVSPDQTGGRGLQPGVQRRPRRQIDDRLERPSALQLEGDQVAVLALRELGGQSPARDLPDLRAPQHHLGPKPHREGTEQAQPDGAEAHQAVLQAGTDDLGAPVDGDVEVSSWTTY